MEEPVRPERKRIQHCNRCGRELTERDIEHSAVEGFCTQCAPIVADQLAELAKGQELDLPMPPEEKRKRLVMAVVTGILIGAAGVTLMWPAFAGKPKTEPPHRIGVTGTDASTDECIENLWVALGELREGRSVDTGLACPETSVRYVITGGGASTLVECPNPSAHGLDALFVRAGDSAPTAQE